jgi:hypothetical protein
LASYTFRLEVTLFSLIFTGEGRSKARAATLIGIVPCSGEGIGEREGAVIHVLFSDGSLKWHAVCMASAEMLNCKLQVNTSCWHKAFVLCMMCWKSPMASYGRTLARTLCSGEEANAIAW